MWKWAQQHGGRPGNFYMTVDDGSGKIIRFV